MNGDCYEPFFDRGDPQMAQHIQIGNFFGRQTLLVSLLTIAFANLASGADTSLDPGGWQQFKWGMSYEQVLRLSQGQSPSDSDHQMRYGTTIKVHAMIFGLPEDVSFAIGCGDIGLHSVRLDFAPKDRFSLRTMVEQQFGRPDHGPIDLDRGLGSQEFWNFPSTTVHYYSARVDERETIVYYNTRWFPTHQSPIDQDAYCRANGMNTIRNHSLH